MFKVWERIRWFLLICCLGDVSTALFAQKTLRIQADGALPKNLNLSQYTYTDSTSLRSAYRRLLQDLQQLAYLEASLDSLGYRDSLAYVWLHLGPVYRWGNLHAEHIPAEWWRNAQQEFRKKTSWVTPDGLTALQKNLLRQAGNAGYPFAQIRLDSIQVSSGQLDAHLRLDKGPLIYLDTLILRGEATLASGYLERYLGLPRRSVYDQSRMERIRERVQELPFVQLKSDPLVEFKGNRASLLLELNRQKASRFDFLIGVLPNSQQFNRLLVTGTFEGELQNQFGRGERLYARFEQLRPRTPRLDLQFNYPFVANLPLGTDFRLHLYRRDTAFLDLDLDFGLQYLLEGGNYWKIFWNQRSSRLLQLNEALLLAQQMLPPTLDLSYSSFGLEFQQQALDYRFNPRRGWAFLGRGSAGTKRILPNNRIAELGLAELYDTLPLRTFQYRLLSVAESYLPLGKNSTLQFKASTGWTLANAAIYQNEQFRIGGNRLMRGFDEEFIFATHYAIGTAEARLLLSRNSYLYSFGDLGWIANRTTVIQEDYRVYGFGGGITFETRAGLFGLSLAFGARMGSALDFGGPKVHFGYVSLF
jgi:outer membrane translocation and assembly module TamA